MTTPRVYQRCATGAQARAADAPAVARGRWLAACGAPVARCGVGQGATRRAQARARTSEGR